MAPPTRDDALATLEEGQVALDGLLARLDDDQLTRPATIGGGDWSAKELLGHIAFWEELAIQALDATRAGRSSDAEGIFSASGVDAANARNQERTAAQSVADVRARATAAHRTIVSAIQTMSDAEWRARVPAAGTRRETLISLLGGVLGAHQHPFGHAFAHLPDLQTYVESVGH